MSLRSRVFLGKSIISNLLSFQIGTLFQISFHSKLEHNRNIKTKLIEVLRLNAGVLIFYGIHNKLKKI